MWVDNRVYKFSPLILAAMLLASCRSQVTSLATESGGRILSVEANGAEIEIYQLFELSIALEASYDSPFDARQMALSALFTGPDGQEWTVPGFWDGQAAWRVRFTPSQAGQWRYRLAVTDALGESQPWEGEFTCAPAATGEGGAAAATSHGWLQVGRWVNPAYSPRYLVHHDGTPFYGLGHCDAFTLMSHGYDETKGFRLFDEMISNGENMLVYWPVYSNPFFNTSYDQYSYPDAKIIDLIVADAARKGIYLVFTVWDHSLLRDNTHPWGNGLWETQNGFRRLGDLEHFFSDAEAWAWQENLYRYMIARWGYSPAIGLWQTVSEIEGTNVGSQMDGWHRRVNDYFATHDPYRHPTTASMAGDAWWPAGYRVMDVLQVHSYDSKNDPAGTGPAIAGWTGRMWQAEEKPNWVGEFGSQDGRNYPELFHNAIWAGLANGAAATPMEWNDGSAWGRMTAEMYTQLGILADFISTIPLAQLNPDRLEVQVRAESGADPAGLQAWGLGGEDWGFFWVQDVSAAGQPIEVVRQAATQRSGAAVTIIGLAPGAYTIRPYDTWSGGYFSESQAVADQDGLTFTLPEFSRDLAVKVERR